jgi:hypothetical protein
MSSRSRHDYRIPVFEREKKSNSRQKPLIVMAALETAIQEKAAGPL